MTKIYTFIFFFFVFFLCYIPVSLKAQQNIDLENLGSQLKKTFTKNPFHISGGVSASTVFYHSNVYDGRDKFDYFLNGNLNLGIYNWSVPVSYSLTNQGSQLGYQIPYNFNRISLTPKYKWIKAYIGDVGMSFSPYTLNGLMFTGGGLELTPKIPLKITMMAGRMNKAVEPDSTNAQTMPSYKRMGYGTQLRWEKQKYQIGVIGFYAKDDVHSLKSAPDSEGVLPQGNFVLSVMGKAKPYKNLELYAEYANSILTNDLRADGKGQGKGLAALFYKGNSSAESNSALNGGINLSIKSGTIGVRYEKVSPEYRTLGAYYFDNDMENITLNTSLTLFKGILSLSANVGRQRDNLDNQKAQQTSRWAGSANVNVKFSQKLMLTANYSNFTMYTNNQLNQFTAINDNPLSLQQPEDSINYKQISQNINATLNYNISNQQELTQNLSVNYSLNDMAEQENNIVRKGDLSRFQNAALNYTVGLPKKKLNLTASLNYTHSYVSSQASAIWGPSIIVNKIFLNNKLTANLSVAYNSSTGGGDKTNVTNFRLGANYSPWKKHNFTVNIIQMYQTTNQLTQHPKINELTASFAYSYNF